MSLYLRKANEGDKKRYLDWANDPEVRQASFNTEEIKPEAHDEWFKKKLNDGSVILYVCMDFFASLGQVRIERDEEDASKAYISYSVDRSFRGQGIGKKELAMVEKEIGKDVAAEGIKELCAYVKTSNPASKAVFEGLGYSLAKEDEEKLLYVKSLKNEDADVKDIKKDNRKDNKREAGIELLRIVAMLMVITLHFLGKGEYLPEVKSNAFQSLPWLLEAACLPCVNVYVIISGMYGYKSRFCLRRAAMLWLQIFFYSALIGAGFYAYAYLNGDNTFIVQYFNIYNLLFMMLPVMNGHYWFMGAYFILYLIMPFLNAGIKNLDERTHRVTSLVLLAFWCIGRSVMPFELIDDRGLGVIWFVILYLASAYAGKYGLAFMEKKGRGLICFIASVFLTYLSYGLFAGLMKDTTFNDYAITVPSAYNYIFVLTASFGLVYFFRGIKIKEGFLSKLIKGTAPYVLGVYLLHEHVFIRYRWPRWIGVTGAENLSDFILKYIYSLILIFIAGITVDIIRSYIFNSFEKLADMCLKLYYSKKETFDYLITGGLTTVINWLVYVLCAYSFFKGIITNDYARENFSNFVAWVAAVLFAYITNRIFVFHSDKHGFVPVMKEFAAFTAARVLSFVVEQILFSGAILIMNDIIAKLIIGVVVIILNYFFSKLWIFKKG